MDNIRELEKIEKATSGWFKKSARQRIAAAINEMKPHIESAKALPENERKEKFKYLLNKASEQRKYAVQSDATSYSHPQWSAAAACESWLFELINGTPDNIIKVELLINGLSMRD